MDLMAKGVNSLNNWMTGQPYLIVAEQLLNEEEPTDAEE